MIQQFVLNSEISNDSKLLYAILDSYTSRETDSCWPGQQRLARDLRKTDRHVRACLVELREIGAVTWEIIAGPLGRKAIYTIHYKSHTFKFPAEGVRNGGSAPWGGGSGTVVPDGSGTGVPVIQLPLDPAIRSPKAPAPAPAPAARTKGPLAPAQSGGTGQGRAGQGRAEPRPVPAKTRAEREELERAVGWRDVPCAKCAAPLPDAELWLLHNGRRVPSVVTVGYSDPYFDAKGTRKFSFRATGAYHRDCAVSEKITK